MNLGDIIDRLKELPEDLELHYEDGKFPGLFDSYRGYYDQLALSDDWNWAQTVGVLLREAEAAVGTTFQGYKGGDFVMRRTTPVWRANYGDSGSVAILRIDGDGTIQTAYIGDYE